MGEGNEEKVNLYTCKKFGMEYYIWYFEKDIIGKGKVYPRTGHEGPEGE
jgi:hypothetical protein